MSAMMEIAERMSEGTGSRGALSIAEILDRLDGLQAVPRRQSAR